MRAAPAVDAALDDGGRERMLITGLHALAGANLMAWALAHAGQGLTAASLAGVVLAAGGLAAVGWPLARRALPAEPGHLRWDGQAWQLVAMAPRPLDRLVVAIDLGAWMLLRLLPADGPAALWRVASARAAGPAWHGLRVALAAHAGAAADRVGPPS